MINTVNIDLTNSSCWGTSNAAGEGNEITLYIKLLESLLNKTDIHLEFTKPDGVIIETQSINVVNEQVSYEMPFNLYVTKGTLKLRIIATGYTSDYINFKVLDDYAETDDICVKFNNTTKEFNISKCVPGGAGQTTVQVGTTTTGEPGTDASVTNSGTDTAAILNFTIPRGDPGAKGDQGEQGIQGIQGEKGDKGDKGVAGTAATITVGTTTTGEPGTDASVTNVGTANAAKFNFTIPKGAKGDKGEPGTISDEVMQQIIAEATAAAKLAALQAENPVGKIRLQTTNVNPATFLGFGTWKLWGAGRVPVGVDTTQSDFATVEKTGGEKKHKLTIAEIASHGHGQYLNSNYGGKTPYTISGGGGEAKSGFYINPTNVIASSSDNQVVTDFVGGNQEHNNLQPYITCYMWKRTA